MLGSGRDQFAVAGLTLKCIRKCLSQAIDFTLHHYHGSSKIVSIVQDLYSNMYGFVFVNDTLTKLFSYTIIRVLESFKVTCFLLRSLIQSFACYANF